MKALSAFEHISVPIVQIMAEKMQNPNEIQEFLVHTAQNSKSVTNISDAIYLLDKLYPEHEFPLDLHNKILRRVAKSLSETRKITREQFVRLMQPVHKHEKGAPMLTEMTISNLVKCTNHSWNFVKYSYLTGETKGS